MEVKCCLEAFLQFDKEKDIKKFTIVDGTEKLTPDETTGADESILLVLDSSFNPPHWGHYTLIKKAYEYYHQVWPEKEINILLLLSVQNADKSAKPATFDKRVEMMCIMARLLTRNFDLLAASVGLTIFGKFIDKDEIIRDRFFNHGKIIYLVGFDTITRIFDPKYYLPNTPAVALGKFMRQTEFCCLTRHENSDSKEESLQLNYPKEILTGKYEPVLPREWGNKVNVLINDPKYCHVSSSEIRKAILKLTNSNPVDDTIINNLKDQLPNEIIQYITNESESKSIFSE